MDKRTITEEVLKEIDSQYDLESALKSWWWFSYSNVNSVRLTKAGHAAINQVMKPFVFDCTLNNTGTGIKQLIKLGTPFYADFQNQQITIYSAKLATMIKIYPSFNRYIEIINK